MLANTAISIDTLHPALQPGCRQSHHSRLDPSYYSLSIARATHYPRPFDTPPAAGLHPTRARVRHTPSTWSPCAPVGRTHSAGETGDTSLR